MPVDRARFDEAHERARALVLRFGWNPAAYQILNPGMRLWFAAAGDAVAGFGVHGNTWVVAGAPVCDAQRLPAVARELQDVARDAGAVVLYFGAGERLEHLLGGTGAHRLLRLGAMPVWDARAWDRVVAQRRSLRAQIHRARNKDVIVEEWAALAAQDHAQLRAVLAAWLDTRGLPPLHFMTEPDLLGDLRDRRVFLARRDEAVIAFLVATPVPARRGWLVEEWPRVPGAPNGTTQLLVDAAMRSFAAAGDEFVTLGLAPLSDRGGAIGEGEPLWLRLMLRWMRAHGKRFYNFQGLDAFKAALVPTCWEPLYVILPADRTRAHMLWDIAGVFGGGSPLGLVGRAMLMAAAREVRRLAGTSH